MPKVNTSGDLKQTDRHFLHQFVKTYYLIAGFSLILSLCVFIFATDIKTHSYASQISACWTIIVFGLLIKMCSLSCGKNILVYRSLYITMIVGNITATCIVFSLLPHSNQQIVVAGSVNFVVMALIMIWIPLIVIFCLNIIWKWCGKSLKNVNIEKYAQLEEIESNRRATGENKKSKSPDNTVVENENKSYSPPEWFKIILSISVGICGVAGSSIFTMLVVGMKFHIFSKAILSICHVITQLGFYIAIVCMDTRAYKYYYYEDTFDYMMLVLCDNISFISNLTIIFLLVFKVE